MAWGKSALWQGVSALSAFELLLVSVFPVSLWASCTGLVYLLFFWSDYELLRKHVHRLLLVTLAKSVVFGMCAQWAIFSLILIYAMTQLQREDPADPGLPVHTKSPRLSLSGLLAQVETLSSLLLLIYRNPITALLPLDGFTLAHISIGLQLFLILAARSDRHLHWKLLSVNLIILARELVPGARSDIWLAAIAPIAGYSLTVSDSAVPRGSLLCVLLSAMGLVHIAAFPGQSLVLSATTVSAVLTTSLGLCFTLSPPLWVVFSSYQWLRGLHLSFLVHFLLPLFAVAEGESLSLSARTL